jgi:hypothetical protein
VLVAAVELLLQHLARILGYRPALSIEVTRHQLSVDGVGSEEPHPVLRSLASRLHRHQLAAIRLRPGLEVAELSDLVAAMAAETWRQGKPLGLEPLERLLGRWPHVAFEPLPLDQLELGEDSAPNRQADRIWQGLVNSAMLLANEAGENNSGTAGSPPTGADVGMAIRARRGDASYDRAVVDWMMQVDAQLANMDEGSSLHQKVAELFGALDAETLRSVLELGATPEQRRRLLLSGSRPLPVGAVLDLLRSTASSSGKNPSHALLRMLGKLAGHAEPGRGPVVVGAEDVLRDSVRHLLGDWQGEDPSPQEHRDLLELLARPGASTGGGAGGKTTPSAARLVQMGLELGISTPGLEAAVTELAGGAGIAGLMEMRDRAEAAGLDPALVWNVIVRPAYLGEALLAADADLELLKGILERAGASAAEPLLDALEAAGSASRRHWLLARLEGLGEEIGPLLVARLPGKPWYLVRNLLSLLGSLPQLPAGFSPEPFAEHEDPRVRREAYRMLFGNPTWRSAAIMRGVADADPQNLRLALIAATEQCSPELPARLFELLRERYRDPQDRATAIRLLARRPTWGMRDWLLAQVATERGFVWFRRTRLLGKSGEMLAALEVLATAFARDPQVARVLTMAGQSRDPEIRAGLRTADAG